MNEHNEIDNQTSELEKIKKYNKILLVLVLIAIIISSFSVYRTYGNIVNNTDSSTISGIETRLGIIFDDLRFLQFNYKYSGGIVTDKVVVYHSDLYKNVEKGVSGTIDIRPQPSYDKYFVGEGKINLSDRELRVLIKEIIDEVQSSLKNSGEVGIVYKDLDITSLSITTQNYDVGTYENGTIKLIGE